MSRNQIQHRITSGQAPKACVWGILSYQSKASNVIRQSIAGALWSLASSALRIMHGALSTGPERVALRGPGI